MMDRREFLAKAGLVATWAGVAVTVSSCSDDSPTDPGGGTGGTNNDATGVVTGGGHSHGGAVITEAQLNAGLDVTLTLTGTHTHQVQLTAQQVMDVADGIQVSVDIFDGHSHTITFN